MAGPAGGIESRPLRSRRAPDAASSLPAGTDARDAELMARTGEGDRAAGHELYVAHRDAVYATALRFLGDEAAARDVTQEVFVSLLTHGGSYRPTARFSTYLRRVTVNRCINERASARHSGRVEASGPVLDDVASGEPGADALRERAETEAGVRAAVAALPERQRMAVILARFEGLSYEEIAEALDCSVSSVESLLFRARQKLAATLGAPPRAEEEP
jgi:RNA polymerase sigma-70 factor, ECF subfamily